METETAHQAAVTLRRFLAMQVCVPARWSDHQVIAFAERSNPSGTTSGWQIRRQGDPALAGDPERAACDHRAGFVHIMLDA